MNVPLTPTGGRYPYHLAKYDPANIRAYFSINGATISLRIDDVENADRWEEFIVPRDVLLNALHKSQPTSNVG